MFRLGTVFLIAPCQLTPKITQRDDGNLRTCEKIQVVFVQTVDGAVHIGVHRQPIRIVLILQNHAVALRQIHGGVCGLVEQVAVMQNLDGQIGKGDDCFSIHQFYVFHGVIFKNLAFLVRPEHGHDTVFGEFKIDAVISVMIVGNIHGNLRRSVHQRALLEAVVVQFSVIAGHTDHHRTASRFAGIIAGVQRVRPISNVAAGVAPVVMVNVVHTLA